MAGSKRKNNAAGKSRASRPQGYLSAYCKIAKKMSASGATISELAEEFEASPQEVRRWQKEHQEFGEACQVGKALRDGGIEQALYTRSIGYEYEVERPVMCNGEVHRVKYKAEIPASLAAGRFYLINRAVLEWSKKPEPKPENRGQTKEEIRKEAIDDALKHAEVLRPRELPPP